MNKVYLNNLKKQFLNAQGNSSGCINYKEFEEYLLQLNRLGNEYRNILSELGLNINDSNIVEINKGILDSVAYANSSLSIITPYTDEMSASYENEIYRFKFVGNKGIPSFKTSSGIIYDLSNLVPYKHTFITQNPYNYSEIEGFSILSQLGYYSTIFGMYGMIYDKDYINKIKMFESVRSDFQDYKEEIITDGDKYFLVARSNVKVKTKSR